MRCLSSVGSGSVSIGTYWTCNRRPIAVRASRMRACLSRDGTGIDLGMALSRELLRLSPLVARLPRFEWHNIRRDPLKSILPRLSRGPLPCDRHIPRFMHRHRRSDLLNLGFVLPRPKAKGGSEPPPLHEFLSPANANSGWNRTAQCSPHHRFPEPRAGPRTRRVRKRQCLNCSRYARLAVAPEPRYSAARFARPRAVSVNPASRQLVRHLRRTRLLKGLRKQTLSRDTKPGLNGPSEWL